MSGDTSNFLVAEAQLELEATRKKKSERTKTLGDPFELPGKALAIEIDDGVAWIGENTTVIRKVDLETGKTLQIFKGHNGPVTAIAFTRGEGGKRILISGSWDQSIKLWDLKSKTEFSTTHKAHEDFVKTLFVIASLNLLVSGSSDKIVRFWDLSNPEATESLRSMGSISSHTRPVECIDGKATSDTTAILYTGDTMGIIKVWELKKEDGPNPRWISTLVDTISHHRTRINELYYGRGQLWTASTDETVRVVIDKSAPSEDEENASKKPPVPITHPVGVRALLPLPLTDLAEPYVITGAGDIIRTYDVSSPDEPELIGEVDAHWHDITAIRLWMRKTTREDGKVAVEPWVITTSLDRTIRKWRLTDLLNPPMEFKTIVRKKSAEEETKVLASGLTEEEERELEELMGDD